MATKDRVKKYRTQGGASDLVRVEVLVPQSRRGDIVEQAAAFRKRHRERIEQLAGLCDKAMKFYSVRLMDNLQFDSVKDIDRRATLIANALIERTDARGFILGRKILETVKDKESC